MPLAWRYASRRSYDVVLTSSHACVKGFWPGRAALHLSYCYTPMRYAWLPALDQRSGKGRPQDLGAAYLRRWDQKSAAWVDDFAAISTCVRDRIERWYGRPARVIHPPVDVGYYSPSPEGGGPGRFALAVGRMVGYKRFDLAVRACHRVGYPLVVAGAGPEEARLRALAAGLGADVTFVIDPGDDALRELYRRAEVLVFPGEEDFGIVPVEAQACGTPVLAYGKGGVTDTVVPGVTGVLVDEQDEQALATALLAVLEHPLDPERCRSNAARFGLERFRAELRAWVATMAKARGLDPGAGLS
jgi:glycosyltransferase involved in cell wall biosynthesis